MTPDNIPPEVGWPLVVVLWLVVIVTAFVDYREDRDREGF